MLGPIHTNPGISKTAAYFDTQIRVKRPNHSGERFQKEAVSVNRDSFRKTCGYRNIQILVDVA